MIAFLYFVRLSNFNNNIISKYNYFDRYLFVVFYHLTIKHKFHF